MAGRFDIFKCERGARRAASAWAVRLAAPAALVAAACALPVAPMARSEVAIAPIVEAPSPPCNLPTTDDLIIWRRVPGAVDRAEIVSSADLYTCRPMLDELRGPALGLSEPGYCTKVAWRTDNPGYSTLISPTIPLKKVFYQVGDC
ncbi:hypothetical protein A5672_05340 [Mycobacterium alsense]|uniref:Lipoprotein n=1 Tax=Mycobacterium alsense TaxID=324058 RepID=A0ABD6NUL3_9MYCO|nr:hypothetical protein [Mycobacterium alsense]OBG27346.1 hypothetical protein A5672_05340 [Mycobacterium alsense]